MTPKEKAKELYNAFHNSIHSFADEGVLEHETAKQCALIAVNEMIKLNGDAYLNQSIVLDYYRKTNAYLFEVKSEIEKM